MSAVAINGGLLALVAALVAGVLGVLVLLARANATLLRQLLAARAGDLAAAASADAPRPAPAPRRAIVADLDSLPTQGRSEEDDAFAELNRRVASTARYEDVQ